MSSLARRALPVIAIGQFLAAGVNAWTGLGVSLSERAQLAGIPPELPPGAFFSIWGVIFLLYTTFAIAAQIQWTATIERVAAPLALAGLGNIVWMLEAQLLTIIVIDFVLLFAVAAPAWIALRRFDNRRDGENGWLKHVIDALTGLVSGWIAVAISISAPPLLRAAAGLTATDHPWPMLMIALGLAAGAAWLAAARFTRGLWFFVALAWGLAGVSINNFERTDMDFLGWAAAITAALIIVVRALRGAIGKSSAVSP